MPVDMMEKALWEMTWMNQFSFILEYREYIGFGRLETNPNWHLVTHSSHMSSFVVVGSYCKAPGTSLSYHLDSKRKAPSKNLFHQSHYR